MNFILWLVRILFPPHPIYSLPEVQERWKREEEVTEYCTDAIWINEGDCDPEIWAQ